MQGRARIMHSQFERYIPSLLIVVISRGCGCNSLCSQVLKSVKECPFPLQNAEQISSLRGVGKVLSQKLLEIISGSTGESSTAATAGIPAPPQAIAARIRAEPKEKPCEKRGRLASYKPEQGKVQSVHFILPFIFGTFMVLLPWC